jgi:hypothetical protein
MNDFMYFVIRPDKSSSRDALLYCSGINIDRFLPITRGRHRPMSNPAVRGLQLVNLGVRSIALANGATPKAVRENNCKDITPPKDCWSTERLLIENAPESLPDEIIGYCVINLLKKIFNAIYIHEAALPDKLLEQNELQVLLESLCSKYGA